MTTNRSDGKVNPEAECSPFVPPVSSTSYTMLPPPLERQSASGGLRVPSTGPQPQRGLPVNSQQRVNSGRARGKVELAPGHSPMDWAALSRSADLGGVSNFQRVTPSQLRTMTGRHGKPAWSSWQHSKVYNITPYLSFHPGGKSELMKAAGRDGTKLFMDVHPWVNWENMLGSCLVGVMVSEDAVAKEVDQPSSSLDELD